MTRPPNLQPILSRLSNQVGENVSRIALGVSGGPDSMALCHFLSSSLKTPDHKPGHKSAHRPELSEIHAVIIDHGLRKDSAQEAQTVKTWLEDFPGVQPFVYTMTDLEPGSRVQELARHKRYDLLKRHCGQYGIAFLVTAHHQDDQAETFLFRLARGSGMDGLAAMEESSRIDPDIVLIRPALDVPKQDLVAYCEAEGVPYVQDPSNECPDFARPRLRAGRDVLEQEGLTTKRLATTARRIRRARQALEHFTDQAYSSTVVESTNQRVVYNFAALEKQPQDIRLRILIRTIRMLHPGMEFGPRYEKVEGLEHDIFSSRVFRPRTLGKCIFSRNFKEDRLIIEKE